MATPWIDASTPTRAGAVVATLGPASFGREAELARVGASAFRLNASHLTPAEIERALRRACEASPETPIVVDLQGAKVRLGELAEREVHAGERVALALDPAEDDVLPLPHPELFRSIEPGQTLGCDDDRLRLRILQVGADHLEAECLDAGRIRSRMGVNPLEHPVLLDDLTAGDAEQLAVVRRHEGVAVAISFMLDGREAEWVRRRLPDRAVIGKVERRGALERLGAIAAAVDELWICRGDLGAQLGLSELAAWVGGFRPDRFEIPVRMAGQVLEHLTEHAEPTRSEACHLHDLRRRGYAGIVLSDETAIGRDPVRAAALAASLWSVPG